jgi:serine/threonine protein kinase
MASEPPAKGARHSIRIGKYEVLRHIATGGMGAVYKAVDVDLGREVALKVMPPEMAARPGMLERFRREAQHAAKLRYKHIVSIYDFGEASGTFFLALEFVDGIDLLEYIRRKGRLEPDESHRILIQAAKALAHYHQLGIVHRDIKPSNFLITQRRGRPFIKLTDLGLARTPNADDCRITGIGTTVGTIDYMAPEQARDSGAADIRSDLYALGCTFYHMLTGQAPFAEGGLAERLYKHMEAEPADVRQFNPHVPESLIQILRRLLAKQPADRYQTPTELLKDLLPHREQHGNGSRPDQAAAAGRGILPTGVTQPKIASDSDRRALLAGLAQEVDAGTTPPRRKPGSSATIVRPRLPGRKADDTRENPASAPQTLPALPTWWPFALLGAIALIVAVVSVALALRPGAGSRGSGVGGRKSVPSTPSPLPRPAPSDPRPPATDPPAPLVEPRPPSPEKVETHFPTLYQPRTALGFPPGFRDA